ncbi:hypothetical protein CHS0354_023488 [Potamilus streckersoni]|uniref:Uncharacterized protein n=1 Tax=Potamilus streckersoni TaxID=2493646 RepID=A0AAE0S7J0_9BIVA|nr:hypothetical protein CHS0354_023488 [Potamilus streckersoni]
MKVTNMIGAGIILVISITIGQSKYLEDVESTLIIFQLWKSEYGKQYQSVEEEEGKFQIFRDNLKWINQLNDEYSGFTEYAVNKFADMSKEEFMAKILMVSRPYPKHNKDRILQMDRIDDIPETFDWTTQGKVTSVKDQGSAGSCWAFSTIGNIEGQWAMMGKKLTNFSVEQIVDCDGTEDIVHEHADCGIYGGWPYLAYQYVMKAGGLESWDDYPYCCGLGGGPGTCFTCPAPSYNKTLCGPPIPWCNMTQSCVFKVDKSKFVPGLKVIDWKLVEQNESAIAEVLIKYGPLSVALDARLLQFYHRGVFKSRLCSKASLDHAVLLVGYGTDKSLFETTPYWKVKNSWGAKWGESGYFRIERGTGMCGINTQVTTAFLQE